jgi:recombination protein RecR
MISQSIQKLIALFSKFPTVGPRTAARFVYYLIGLNKAETDEIINSISALKKNIRVCRFCFSPFEPFDTAQGKGHGDFCNVCLSPLRDKSLLCIVEKEADFNAIEKTKKYNGRYFILGGTFSSLRRADIEKLRFRDLGARMKSNKEIKEVILAINPTADGEATTLYLERFLKPFNKKTTRLGIGLPAGGELEYADEETLRSALERRI